MPSGTVWSMSTGSAYGSSNICMTKSFLPVIFGYRRFTSPINTSLRCSKTVFATLLDSLSSLPLGTCSIPTPFQVTFRGPVFLTRMLYVAGSFSLFSARSEGVWGGSRWESR
uniref:Uncharacterized protein n=1 Tax=Micromonas pusilla TaxID=38833 RepID=A0A7S0D028_MICPS